jgi:uncharacterized protein YbjQ (UPF0145 family)
MGWLGRLTGGGDPTPGAEEDLARLAAGGVPRAAERRLGAVAAGGGPFTSGFTPADLALSRLEGVRPVGQVMGSSVYKVGWQNTPWATGWGGDAVATELAALTEAWNDARGLALARLEQEARLIGCHAVVDVAFAQRAHAFLSGEVEVVVQGTAVHLPEGGGERPVLTDLSMADYALLRRCGHRPVGVVAATSVWYVVPSWRTQSLTSGWQRRQGNQELPEFTQGLYAARESALARATRAAAALRADGLVGVDVRQEVEHREVERNDRKRTDLVIAFHVLGTAIVEAGEHRPLAPRTVVRQGAPR